MINTPLKDAESEAMAKFIYSQLSKSNGLSTHNQKVNAEVILRVEGLVNESVTTPGLVTLHKPQVFEKWLIGQLSDTNIDAMGTLEALKKSKSKVAKAIARKVLKERYGIDYQFRMALWALILSGISIVVNVLIVLFK